MLDPAALAELARQPLDWRYKGFPPTVTGLSLREVGSAGWNIFDGTFTYPVMLLKHDELIHNLRWMAEYSREHGVDLAPHAKTTMSPQLIQMQFEYGAWGMTVATISQARILAAFGAQRIIVANQILSAADFAWIAEFRRGAEGSEIITLVDSVEGVEQIERSMQAVGWGDMAHPVLLEVGYESGRAGVRDTVTAVEIAERVGHCRDLELIGLEGFEGVVPGDGREEQAPRVRAYLEHVQEVFAQLRGDGLLRSDALITFGGSAYFDVVVEAFDARWRAANDARVVLRSGCYLTHDHGMYDRLAPPNSLRAAIEVVARVTSCPSPGLAIASVGKRDVPYDVGLPVVLAVRRDLESGPPGRVTLTGLNDQHAYIADPDGDLHVGDLVVMGISHPCTAFDKWLLIPVVDADYCVRDAVRTYF